MVVVLINRKRAASRRNYRMPSLFRFLAILGIIVGVGYVAVFSLANFVKVQPREMVVTVPADKFVKPPR